MKVSTVFAVLVVVCVINVELLDAFQFERGGKGKSASTGTVGTSGTKGGKGSKGSSGTKGGKVGSTGTVGTSGTKGGKGKGGSTGTVGTSGTKGGKTGKTGKIGTSGTKGGKTGTKGGKTGKGFPSESPFPSLGQQNTNAIFYSDASCNDLIIGLSVTAGVCETISSDLAIVSSGQQEYDLIRVDQDGDDAAILNFFDGACIDTDANFVVSAVTLGLCTDLTGDSLIVNSNAVNSLRIIQNL